MILWTIQPVEVVEILERDGHFSCKTELSENYEDFRDAYDWIINEMDKRGIARPANTDLPLWAWHTYDWKHKKPDFRTKGLGCRGERCACIEFEIPDEQVLLSDTNIPNPLGTARLIYKNGGQRCPKENNNIY